MKLKVLDTNACLKLVGSLGVDDELPIDVAVIGDREVYLGFVKTYVQAEDPKKQVLYHDEIKIDR